MRCTCHYLIMLTIVHVTAFLFKKRAFSGCTAHAVHVDVTARPYEVVLYYCRIEMHSGTDVRKAFGKCVACGFNVTLRTSREPERNCMCIRKINLWLCICLRHMPRTNTLYRRLNQEMNGCRGGVNCVCTTALRSSRTIHRSRRRSARHSSYRLATCVPGVIIHIEVKRPIVR